ncbi:MAG: GNAT family N-acetyltransferase [Clostridia bacterium]|nr:GNAT family N-acetyltransferase [Clostridia bacterium]
MRLETERLILRPFEEGDTEALFRLLSDAEVNDFLPWFPVSSLLEAREFRVRRFDGQPYAFAICLKRDDAPIGYIKADADGARDLGYALRREFWHQGLTTEAARAVLARLKADGVPYVTATHDRENPRSGGVMRRIGMRYRYSYEELWQPKNRRVVFRLYQLNLDGRNDRTYMEYWNQWPTHFVEEGLEGDL